MRLNLTSCSTGSVNKPMQVEISAQSHRMYCGTTGHLLPDSLTHRSHVLENCIPDHYSPLSSSVIITVSVISFTVLFDSGSVGNFIALGLCQRFPTVLFSRAFPIERFHQALDQPIFSGGECLSNRETPTPCSWGSHI